jgi:hypothetical protein
MKPEGRGSRVEGPERVGPVFHAVYGKQEISGPSRAPVAPAPRRLNGSTGGPGLLPGPGGAEKLLPHRIILGAASGCP